MIREILKSSLYALWSKSCISKLLSVGLSSDSSIYPFETAHPEPIHISQMGLEHTNSGLGL